MRNPTDRPGRLVLGAGGAGDLRGGCARQLAGRGGWVAAPPVAAACRARPGPCRRLADRGHVGLGLGVPWAPGPRHLPAIGLGLVWTPAAGNLVRGFASLLAIEVLQRWLPGTNAGSAAAAAGVPAREHR